MLLWSLFGGCLTFVTLFFYFITNYYMVNVGIDIQKVYGKNFTMSVDKIYGIWNWNTFIFAFGAGLVIAFLAGWLPARRAAEVDPVISLRKV